MEGEIGGPFLPCTIIAIRLALQAYLEHLLCKNGIGLYYERLRCVVHAFGSDPDSDGLQEVYGRRVCHIVLEMQGLLLFLGRCAQRPDPCLLREVIKFDAVRICSYGES